jgi:hypothetical protein
MREDTLIKGFVCGRTDECRDLETVVRMKREDITAGCLECDYVWKMKTIDTIREMGE